MTCNPPDPPTLPAHSSANRFGEPVSDTQGDVPGPFHRDARRAIAQLGDRATTHVSTGVWLHLGAWLGWPGWFSEGTSQAPGQPLPIAISAADDLIITANVLARLGQANVITRIMERQRPALGPRAALLYGSAPSVGAALTSICEACVDANPYLRLEVGRKAGALVFTAVSRVPLGSLADFLETLALLLFCKVAQLMAVEMDLGLRLETSLPHATLAALGLPPAHCEVSAGASVNRLILPAELAVQPNPESDPGMWALAQESYRHFTSIKHVDGLAARLRARIVQLLSDGGSAPRLKQIAAEEGLSGRTIIRMLAQEGTSFFELVEQERRKRAIELINDPALSLEQVATRLGFGDASSFGRSFRKWFGVPPGQFRKVSAAGKRQGR